jgi:hypothetical protein
MFCRIASPVVPANRIAVSGALWGKQFCTLTAISLNFANGPRGQTPGCNNVELGRFGRNRTNLWSYAGVNSFGDKRTEYLGMHPTVKPVRA